MRPKRIKEIIAKAVDNPTETPPIHLWGPPGIGKSAIIKQITIEKNIGFVDMRMALRDPTDLRGIPVPEDGKAKWLPPSDLPKDGQGILFLDELTSAPPLTQAGGYQLTLDRAIGEYTLPDGWYVIAAGNRLEDRAVVYRMSTALANRFIHLDYDVNMDDWIEWAMRIGIDHTIIAFIHWRGGDLLFSFDAASSEKAFPTPRTWEFASKIMKVVSKNTMAETLEGTVGRGAAAEFMAFLKVQTELPDPLEILNKGSTFVPKPLSLKYALVSALASRAGGTKHCEALLKYSANLPKEFSVLLIQLLATKERDNIMIAPSYAGWVREHSEIVLPRRAS